MLQGPGMGHLQRDINAGAGHHAAQTTLASAFLYLSRENSGNTKGSDLQSRTRFIKSWIIQRYSKKVGRIFFVFAFLVFLVGRRKQLDCLSNSVSRILVTKLANEAFRDNGFFSIGI